MKNTFYYLLLLCAVFSCVNSSEEPTIDCDLSNTNFEIESSVKASCDTPGSVTLVAQGDATPFTYSSDGVTFQESNTLENLSAGNLELFVKDANSCVISKSFTLEADGNSVSLSLSSTSSGCVNDTGTITAIATNGSGDYTYSLDGGESNATGTFSNVAAGPHEVSVSDSGGCTVQNSITVEAESTVSLSSDIAPIISTNCAISGCHNGSVSPNLSSTSSIIQQANRIKSRTADGSMPRGRTLSETQIKQIACWVDAGAENN